MSQICWEIDATLAMDAGPSDRKRPPEARWGLVNYAEIIDTAYIFLSGEDLSRRFVPPLFSPA
jgi:hypothetical protein